jgi:hypothetical protein
MDCPHCGGRIDPGALKPLQHPVFDDDLRCIVVDGERRHLLPAQWRLLLALRERYRRFVPLDFLAVHCARIPSEGGNIKSAAVHLVAVRRKLSGTPFAIAGRFGEGCGLFPAAETEVRIGANGARYYRLK